MKTSNPTLVVLMTCVLYYACMAVGQSVMRYVGGAQYGTPGMLFWIFPIELSMLALLGYVTKRFFSFAAAGLGAVQGRGRWVDRLLVLIPVGLAGWLLVVWLTGLSPQGRDQLDTGSLLLGIVGIGMVGITEEWMFRGLLLRHFAGLKEWNSVLSRLSKWLMARGLAQRDWSHLGSQASGIIVNAVLFSALHAVNVVGGYPPAAVGYQMIGTLAWGISFGVLACWLPSIRPLMAWHFLWDYFVIVGNYIHVFQ